MFLQDIDRPDMWFEAAWVLTSTASGTAEQIRLMVEHGALLVIVRLLQSPNDDVREQVLVVHNSSAAGHSHRVEGPQLNTRRGGLGVGA